MLPIEILSLSVIRRSECHYVAQNKCSKVLLERHDHSVATMSAPLQIRAVGRSTPGRVVVRCCRTSRTAVRNIRRDVLASPTV